MMRAKDELEKTLRWLATGDYDKEDARQAMLDAAAWLAGGEEVSDWQPIETAPQDGTSILCVESGTYYAAYWTSEQWATVDHFACNPTHWQPLPPPPKVDSKDPLTGRRLCPKCKTAEGVHGGCQCGQLKAWMPSDSPPKGGE